MNSSLPNRAAQSRLRSKRAQKASTRDAWTMHVTSIALLPLTVAFLWIVLSLIGKDYAGVHATLGAPLPAILMLFFLLAGLVHMKLGMQSIIEDYVHTLHWKEAALMGNLFFTTGIGIACVYAVLKLSFT